LFAAATVAPRMPARWARLVAIAALALFVGRMGLVEAAWRRADTVYDRLLAVLDRVPVGARLAIAFPSQAIASDPVPKVHLPVLAILRRDAFVPTLFAYQGQQPIAFSAAGARLAAEAEPSAVWRALMSEPGGDASALAGLADYDLLIALDRRPFTLPATPLLEPLAVEPDFALYRVRH